MTIVHGSGRLTLRNAELTPALSSGLRTTKGQTMKTLKITIGALCAVAILAIPATTMAAPAPAAESLDCALIIYDPGLEMHSTTFESCTGSDGLSVDLHGAGGLWAQILLPEDNSFAQVSFADVSKQVVQLPKDAGSLAGGALLIQRNQDGMFNVSVRRP